MPKTSNPDTDPMRKLGPSLISKPIPPKSVVRLVASPKASPHWKKNVGAIFRVGYYSRKDGLDCIWLVNESGEYQETVDHEYLFKYFDVIQVSNEKNLYGMRRPPIGQVKRARKRRS